MTTSTSSASHHVTDPRPILDRAIATGGAVVAGVRPDQLTDPTPCPEMDVRTMLGHLVGVLDRIAALGHGDDPFAVIESASPDGAWSDVWAAASTRATDAWRDDAVLERPMALPWIQGSGADVLTSYFSELTVHTWDLATATGQQPRWDDTVLTVAIGAPRSSRRRTAVRSSSRSRPPWASTRSPSRSPRPCPCPTTPRPSTASSRGTVGIPDADHGAR